MTMSAAVSKGCCFTRLKISAAAHVDRAAERIPCDRRVLWRIAGVGKMCQWHYDNYMNTHPDIDIDKIVRLSDSDDEFVVRCEPGRPSPRTREA